MPNAAVFTSSPRGDSDIFTLCLVTVDADLNIESCVCLLVITDKVYSWVKTGHNTCVCFRGFADKQKVNKRRFSSQVLIREFDLKCIKDYECSW